MTAKPAAAMSDARSRKMVATENISSSSAGLSLPRMLWLATAGEAQSLPDLEPEQVRDAVGDGDLVAALRVIASVECKARAAVRSARVLRTELNLLDGTRDCPRAVADDVDRPVLLPEAGESCGERARIAAVKIEQLIGRAELGLVRLVRARVVGDRDAPDRGRNGDGEERYHEDLLAPFAAKQPPGPVDEGAARGDAAVRRPSKRFPVSERRHRRSPAARRDSGPGGATVWSTTWPSRRKTTRSAHEASCASCVTTTPATPRLVAARSSRMTASPFTESSAPVGSSASSKPRSPTIARAIATRWRSPPDSSSG